MSTRRSSQLEAELDRAPADPRRGSGRPHDRGRRRDRRGGDRSCRPAPLDAVAWLRAACPALEGARGDSTRPPSRSRPVHALSRWRGGLARRYWSAGRSRRRASDRLDARRLRFAPPGHRGRDEHGDDAQRSQGRPAGAAAACRARGARAAELEGAGGMRAGRRLRAVWDGLAGGTLAAAGQRRLDQGVVEQQIVSGDGGGFGRVHAS